MSKAKFLKKLKRLFLLRGLSMQKRLPLLICALLFLIIAAFSVISYIGVKNAAMKMGSERLMALTEQLSTMFGQSAPPVLLTTRTAAKNEALVNFILSGKNEPDSSAATILKKLRPDSSWVLTELMNTSNEIIYQSGLPATHIDLERSTIISDLALGRDSCKIGKLYTLRDSIYYPVIASVSDKNQLIGYLIRWRLQITTPKSISQFSQLLGNDAQFSVGNIDGSLWTNLSKPVSAPPLTMQELSGFSEFSGSNGQAMIASGKQIGNTPWFLLIEFPRKIVLKPASIFLGWIIIVGIILILLGFLIAWLMSRKITNPIKKLTTAASSIASGNFSQKVEVNRSDEIGKLANAFNTMMIQIGNAQHILEKKVVQRTSQLEESNKELEAFSYSVSHDLRAPLRIINGYADIIVTDYADKLDDEGKRMLGVIIGNAKKMGNLIDDLLNLSRLGRKQLLYHNVDMNKLVASIIEEDASFKVNLASIRIGTLESAYCDNSLIRQVWINLISNAIKYSAKRERSIIEINSVTKENEIVYSIKDNGVGFDMQYVDKLFGVFQRLHNMSEFEGTGVGLALVHRIITRHEGRVWAEAREDKGAVFYFSLPYKKESNQYYSSPSYQNTLSK